MGAVSKSPRLAAQLALFGFRLFRNYLMVPRMFFRAGVVRHPRDPRRLSILCVFDLCKVVTILLLQRCDRCRLKDVPCLINVVHRVPYACFSIIHNCHDFTSFMQWLFLDNQRGTRRPLRTRLLPVSLLALAVICAFLDPLTLPTLAHGIPFCSKLAR